MIRTKLYNSLRLFGNLHTLLLGSGSGGWIVDIYAEKFAVGLPHMHKLVHLSLKYDCNSYFLHTLSQVTFDLPPKIVPHNNSKRGKYTVVELQHHGHFCSVNRDFLRIKVYLQLHFLG